MTFDEVQDIFIPWIANLTGVTVIAARQGIDRPAAPYIMVDKLTMTELTERPSDVAYRELGSQNSEGNNEIEATPLIDVEWAFSVFSYGAGSDVYLQRIQRLMHLSQIQEPMIPALNIHETGVLNNIPEFVDQAWEPRFQMNVMLHGVSNVGVVIDTIETHEPFDIQVKQ